LGAFAQGKDSQLLSLKAELLTKMEKFEEAAGYFKKAAIWHAGDEQVENKAETDEKLSKLYYNAATAYVQVGKGEEALAMYKKVLATEHGASKWAIHNSMGLLYYDFEQDEEAIARYITDTAPLIPPSLPPKISITHLITVCKRLPKPNVCLCMCMHVCVYVSLCVCICMYKCMSVYVYACVCVCIFVRMYMHVYMCVYAPIYACTHACMYVHVHVYV
jgi:hypothetical protein